MALTTVPDPQPEKKKFEPPPEVITTPCDPWPRPYFFEDGLRKVAPYNFTFNTNCKQRWRGRGLLDVFATEFRDRTREIYKTTIESGAISINGKPTTDINHILKNGDVVSHTMHRHEPPVTAKDIGIVHEDDDLIVINKPAGVPVHPAGRYNYNTVVEIMRAERGYAFIAYPCNRLDRLTGGIMFVGKNPKAAQGMFVQLKERSVKKEYLARVIGEFPEGDVVCDQPILQISPKLGLNRVRASGKEARTVFKRVAYYPASTSDRSTAAEEQTAVPEPEAPSTQDGKPWQAKTGYSIVRCLPLTGRTHQIRVHLQFLGHPISNDPIYCNQRVFGHQLGAGDALSDEDEDIISRLSRMGKDQVAEAVAYHDEIAAGYQKRKAEKLSGELCDVCQTPLYSDPGLHELGIYLHARRYECDQGRWSYETETPEWALPPKGYEASAAEANAAEPISLAEEVKKLGLDDGEPPADQAAVSMNGAKTEMEHGKKLQAEAAS